jgi:multimeric flavodoxin WrbA
MKKVIISGSARNDGDTAALTDQLVEKTGWDLIRLNDFHFSYYDYQHQNRDDDFLSLMKQLIHGYDTMIFATPVYWYAMSGIMKVFFDRFTDLLTIEKDLGRQLRGMKMAAISCSHGENLGEQFWLPFIRTAEYLGMEYAGHIHTQAGENNDKQIDLFIKMLEVNRKSS